MRAKITKIALAGFVALLSTAVAGATAQAALAAQTAREKEEPAAQETDASAAQQPKKPLGADLGPDDFALRYYASLNQKERVNAELARLQRLYPGYEAPADLYDSPAEGGGADEEPLWALFAADRLDDLKLAIEAKQRDVANWKPSADLLQKIRRKEFRLKATAFSQSGAWRDLVDLAAREDLNALADIDLLWSVAEGYARTKRTGEAVALYKSILASAKDAPLRIATIQKAMANLRMADIETLLASLPPGTDGELASISVDLTRGRIAAFLHDERAEPVPPAEMAQLETSAKESRDPNQLGLVAWYDYKRRDFRTALDWFKASIENGGDAMIAHGLAHTLRALGMLRESEEVAFAWHEASINNAILFIDLLERDLTRETPPFIDAERLARYARVTAELASGEGAQALAWYAFNSCQFDVAHYWFERAVAWFPKEATVFGYALTLRKLKKDQPFFELANRYDGLNAKLIEILFPDGARHPPTRCDGKDAAKSHGPAIRTVASLVPGPATLGPLDYDASSYAAYANQPPAEPDTVQRERILKAIKGKFPAPATVENPLRFRPLAMPLGSPAAAASPPAPAGPLLMEPPRTRPPLVARRVPGVGPMPYERFGFSLLPGWNGLETATWPPASEQIAPAGTQWANQDSDPGGAGLAAAVGRQMGPYAPGPAAPSYPQPAYGGPPAAGAQAQPIPGRQRGYGPQSLYGPARPGAAAAPAYGQYMQPMSR